ncbi:hypothetical protein K8B33_15665 [Alcanivorax sp. JB21]|uniref:hypothetical protein n=1 Tax=Alcanivorax limicola TaxID=2874102 RepID=UPI001CBC7AE6|nr:hypothetical protein [Alcanivorax limicola]MBZ2190547.1 hypothetical protein [Alcanivorax limicola]
MSEGIEGGNVRARAAAVASLVVVVAIYMLYKFVSPGFPFSVLLAPVIFGQAILYLVLDKVGLANAVGEDALLVLTWIAGGLALWYVYYKLVYFVFWLLGLYKPVQAVTEGEEGAQPATTEDGWLYRVGLVLSVPLFAVVVLWWHATGHDSQHSRQHSVVLTAAEASCSGRPLCVERIEQHFESCFSSHFTRQGTRWLRARYAIEREAFRDCLFPQKRS